MGQKINEEIFDSTAVKVSEIASNSVRSDFGPTVIGDSIYFSSYKDDMIHLPDKKLQAKAFYDLYSAKLDSKGNVVSERRIIPEFETQYHDGPVSWCEKTGELYITQSNYTDPSVSYKPFRNELIRLRIVVAKRENGKWKVVSEFPFNNAEYSVGHPAITANGDSLYFSSDMPGGYGATDLYLSVKKDGKWQKPVNLGAEINTPGKEEFPTVTGNSFPNRYLIFSSTGHNSMGGFDLFYKDLSHPKSGIRHFSAPINSGNDDFAMSLPDNSGFGYFSSNRPGTGGDDIYKITFKKNLKYLQEIVVLDGKTKGPIPRALVDFCGKKIAETGPNGLQSMLFEKNSTCQVKVSAMGYRDSLINISIGEPLEGKILRDTVRLELIVDKKIVLKNIYYDFDRWDILPESAIELDKLISLMKENPNMKVELTSHTDDRGTVVYNQSLSEMRAKATKDYILAKGISSDRVLSLGKGKSQLVNQCIKCTSAQHRENRRTELFIPGFVRGEYVPQNIGDYADGKPDHNPVGYSSYRVHGSLYSKLGLNTNTGAAVGQYYLILGSFEDQFYARKYVERLKGEGIETQVIGVKEPFRVGMGPYKTFGLALKAKADIQPKYSVTWILNSY